MAFYDFEQIKADNPIETVVERLSLNLKKKGNQLRGPCPVCGGGDRNLAVTPEKGAFYCFGGKTGGDVIQLVAHIQGTDVKTAAAYLSGTVPEEKPDKKPASEGGFKELDYLQHDHEAVVAVGFDPEDAKRIGVGYSPRGVMRGHVAVPVRDTTGRLLGYLGITEALLPGSWRF